MRLSTGQFDVDLAKAGDLRSAQALIDPILEHDHYERMTAIQRELAEMKRRDPAFEPARPEAANPGVHRAGEGVTVIRHPQTRTAAKLFNTAYEVMILLLTRLYGRSNESEAEVDGLIWTAFFPLMTAVIRPLGEILTQMPIEEGSTAATAGAPFEFPLELPLQPFQRGAWIFVHERLLGMAESCGSLCEALEQADEPWARLLLPRLGLLHENLERDERAPRPESQEKKSSGPWSLRAPFYAL